MIPFERQQYILSELEKNDFISLTDLVTKLNVSHMTIRRDIKILEQNGQLIQISGGIQSIKKIKSEPPRVEKELQHSKEKDLIGRLASRLIPPNVCIYLDAGTTSLALCKYILDRDDLTVVTNDLEVLNLLMNHNFPNIIHVGGHVRGVNKSTVGYLAANTIKSLRIDIGFLSSSSFDDYAVTTPDPDKVLVKQAVIESSVKKILISDSSKYSHVATYVVFPIDILDTLVTDDKFSNKAKHNFEKRNIEVINTL